MPATTTAEPARHLATGLICLVIGLFLCLSLISYDPAQLGAIGSQVGNWCGPVGAWTAHGLITSLGLAAWYPVLAVVGTGLACLFRRIWSQPYRQLTGALLLLMVLPGLLHLLPVAADNAWLLAWDQVPLAGLGGLLGNLLSADPAAANGPGLLVGYLSTTGAALLLTCSAALAWYLLDLRLIAVSRRIWTAWQRARAERAAKQSAEKRLPPRVQRENTGTAAPPPTPPKSSTAAGSGRLITVDPAEVKAVGKRIQERESTAGLGEARALVERIRQQRERSLSQSDPTPIQAAISLARQQPEADRVESASEPSPASDTALASATKLSQAPDTSEEPWQPLPGEIVPEPEPEGSSDETNSKQTDASRSANANRSLRDGTNYALPDADILDAPPAFDDDDAAAETERTSRFIEKIFSDYKVNVKVVMATRGPYITQYELELLDAGMRVNKVAGLERELSLNLGTEGIRIVAPLPNKKTIGVEVPNGIKEAVVMRDLVEETDANKYDLPLVLGRDVIGNAMVGDLAKMPHLLVAGATGMGKSVCLNSIICSLLLYRGPDEAKFIMVDPKMVELAPYEGIPHLLTPPITDMTKAHAALEWACKVMDERYYALRLAGVRDIKSYNALGEKKLRERLQKKGKDIEDLPGLDQVMTYIIIVVDEYADLMMVNKDVEKSIVRLTAKSRACGIHIILTTQRPSADVVTGLIKSNLPSRICFRVADRNNSRVVLDAAGAENLLGKGDMLYLPPGLSNLIRGQGVWVKDHEIDAIIQHVSEQGNPQYEDNIFAIGAAAMAGGDDTGSGAGSAWLTDRKFHESVQAMYRYNRTGADFLRRKMGIGYNKATNYIEWLEDLGFVSESKGTKPREFLKSWQDWLDELKANDISWDEDDDIYHDPFA